MSVLLLDCTGQYRRIAIWDGGAAQKAPENAWISSDAPGNTTARKAPGKNAPGTPPGTARQLPDMIDEAFARHGMAPQQIERIGVVTGPGNFTGIRASVALARGFALALDIPAVGISGFELVAFVHFNASGHLPHAHTALCVALRAPRGQVFGQLFDARGKPAGPAICARPDALAGSLPDKCCFAGNGAALVCQYARRSCHWRSNGAAAGDTHSIAHPGTMAKMTLQAGNVTGPPEPLYLRPPDIGRPKREC